MTARKILIILAAATSIIVVGAALTSSHPAAPGHPAPVSSGTAPAPGAAVAAAISPTVTYTCTGSAPDGVDITYGPSGSNYSATTVPFTKTMPLDGSAEFYVVTAQLSGSGEVACSATVVTPDGTKIIQAGQAQGGYNIATAQICAGFTGTWEKC